VGCAPALLELRRGVLPLRRFGLAIVSATRDHGAPVAAAQAALRSRSVRCPS
jgi:hypothetical protein